MTQQPMPPPIPTRHVSLRHLVFITPLRLVGPVMPPPAYLLNRRTGEFREEKSAPDTGVGEENLGEIEHIIKEIMGLKLRYGTPAGMATIDETTLMRWKLWVEHAGNEVYVGHSSIGRAVAFKISELAYMRSLPTWYNNY